MEKPVRSSIQNLSISYECALAIGNSLNLPEMLNEVIHTVVHKTNAHRGIIWVKNGEEKLQPVASAGINIEDVLAQGEIMDIRDAFNQILKRQQFVLRYKDEKDFLQFCPVLTGNEESVLIVPVTNVAILYLVYASREIADEPLANLFASLSKKLSVAIEACTAHENVIKEIQVREKAEKELTKKTEQLVSNQKELQGLYGESEQARKSLFSILEDVTQKEEALKESESKINSILSSIDDLVFVFDQEDRFILTQKTTSGQLYTTPDKFIGKKTSEVMPSHLNQIFLDAFDKIRKGQVAEYDYWLKMKGKTLWYSARHSPRFIDGELVGSVAVVRDITERKQLEAELLVKNEVFEASIAANSTSDNEGILTYVNSAFIKIYGYENMEEAVGKPISDFLKFEDEAMNIITALNETGVWEGEYTGLRKDKTTFAAYALATIIKDRSGDTIGYQSAVQDISDRKRMEEILKESEEKYSSVVENSMDGIIVLQKGIIKFLNQALLDLTGYNMEELIDKEFETILSPEYRKLVMDRYQARLAGKDVPSMYEMEIIRKNGISVPIEVSNTIITYGGEKATLSFVRNITERKQAEEKEKKHHKNIELLSETAMQFVEFPADKNIYNFIGEQLRELIGKDSYIAINTIDEEKSILTTRAVLGIGKFTDKIDKLLGRHPVGMTFDTKDEGLVSLSDGKLHLNEEGLYGIFLKAVPKTVCNSLEKLLNIKKIYGIGLTKENELFGTAVIFFKEDAGELKNKQIIETFIQQASIAVQKRQAELSLQEVKAELKHTIEVVPSIIIKANGHTGYFTYCNPTLSSILGFSLEEFLARPFFEFIHPDDRQSTINEVENQLKGSPIARFENRYICKNGSYKWLEWEARAADEKGVIYAAATDITERKQTEKELHKLNDELEQRVIERTAELKENNEGLESMVKAFTGREIRMIELKDIIKDLEEQLVARENKGE